MMYLASVAIHVSIVQTLSASILPDTTSSESWLEYYTMNTTNGAQDTCVHDDPVFMQAIRCEKCRQETMGNLKVHQGSSAESAHKKGAIKQTVCYTLDWI